MPDAISLSVRSEELGVRSSCHKILLVWLCLLSVVQMMAQRHFGVITYNCENAFDTIHDAGRNDYEFLPDGSREWSRARFFRKLKNIGKVVLAADSVQPVDLVCLCEVENDTVMTYLTRRTLLSSVGYRYVMTQSDDERGIDVALMYSPYTFRPVEVQTLRPDSERKTRDVLRVAGVLLTGDTLDVYAVHLPSKLGGRAADKLRTTVARMLRMNIDSISDCRTSPNIIVMGDFNDVPKSNIMKIITGDGVEDDAGGADGMELHNLMTDKKNGSYKYKGVWSMIDQVLVSGSLLRPDNGIYTMREEAKVVDLPFLLEEDRTHKGMKPKRSFLGTMYRRGFSDHLPVYVRFKYNY